FAGRIWVEDQDFNIVRFNGSYSGGGHSSWYFNFDSWRTNVQPGIWLPTFVYSEEKDLHYALSKKLDFKAQTRLWGYNLGHSSQEQELSKILIEGTAKDETTTANDLSPVQAQRSWDRQAEDNVIDRLQRIGLISPKGDVDKVLETVVNNLEVTNNIDVEPDVRCRVMMTSTLESYTVGHTIVLSRGLVDVLPDETSLAAILAHELGHIVLGHGLDTQLGFYDTLRHNEKKMSRQFDVARPPEEEQEANQKGIELLRNSPYKEHYRTAQLFLDSLKNLSKDIPNLIRPNLGDRVPTSWTIAPKEYFTESDEKPTANVVAALPLGGHIAIDPWND